MPLIHSKKPKAFSENVATEMHAGKPLKQSLAIAYSEKRHAEHKHNHAEGGMVHDCPACMAEGGNVESGYRRENNERGVHKGGENSGSSRVGFYTRAIPHGPDHESNIEEARSKHHKVIEEMRSMKKPNLYAEGGEVKEPTEHSDDDEIHGMLGEELMGAFERKDKKAIMECLHACVSSLMNKESE